MPLKSNYENGKFYNDKWFCACDIEAPWLTSRKEHSLGEKFASCTKPRDQQCGFFLTAVDDNVARLTKASNVPPAPRTPVSTRTQPWLTPRTGSSSRDVFFGGSAIRTRNLNLDDSPTSHRYRGGDEGRGDEDADELASMVIGLLRRDCVAIRSSTESAIRHTIGDRVAKYDAALLNTEKSLSFAQKKLDELERGVTA
ncbi:hypothetical protein NHJ13734_009698 [Beauveria thailandica]